MARPKSAGVIARGDPAPGSEPPLLTSLWAKRPNTAEDRVSRETCRLLFQEALCGVFGQAAERARSPRPRGLSLLRSGLVPRPRPRITW